MKRTFLFFKRYIYTVIRCLFVFTIGIFSGKNRVLLYRISSIFGYDNKKNETAIPKISLAEILPNETLIDLLEPIGVDGNVSLLELVVIDKLIRYCEPNRLFEIGTFDGRTTLNMAANCPSQAMVYTLDLPKDKMHATKLPIVNGDRKHINKEVSGSRYFKTGYEKKIIQLYGDSATFDSRPFLNNIDFIFIDGSHSYEYVLNDSMFALKLLRNGKGIILWHDYGHWEGVSRALDELFLQVAEFRKIRHIEGTTLGCLIIE